MIFDPDNLSDNLTGYDGQIVSGGLSTFLALDQSSGEDRFPYIGNITKLSGGIIKAQFEDCSTPRFCYFSNTELTLTPTLAGFNVQFSNDGGNLAGYSIPGKSSFQLRAGEGSFFIPAQFRGLDLSGAVPEPATWAMMIIGFGFIGQAMRRENGDGTFTSVTSWSN